MDHEHQPLETLQDIKRMMERSSRFISLSGWSGIAAGICALTGAWLAVQRLHHYKMERDVAAPDHHVGRSFFSGSYSSLVKDLMIIAGIVFLAASVLAFIFTYIKSKRAGVPVWDATTKRLFWNTVIPIAVGGICILRMLQDGYINLVAPCCLIFYGLALVNAAKYTLSEVRYLGYGQIILGLINLWMVGYGLVFWALGFGCLHIIYGFIMWWKYDRR